MRHITFVAKAAVISTVVTFASGATASTVDTLEDQSFFAPMSDTEDTSPYEVTVGVGAGTEEDMNEAMGDILVPAQDLMETPLAIVEPHAIGIAMERAHVDRVYSKAVSNASGDSQLAAERGFMRAPLSSAITTGPLAAVTTNPFSAVTTAPTAANITVPLPASGILLVFGLFGLARFSRQTA